MNLGRFANWLSMMTGRITGTVPLSSGASPSPPPAPDHLVTDGAVNFVTSDGDQMVALQL